MGCFSALTFGCMSFTDSYMKRYTPQSVSHLYKIHHRLFMFMYPVHELYITSVSGQNKAI